jgi:molybdate transport system substrate-binding protein
VAIDAGEFASRQRGGHLLSMNAAYGRPATLQPDTAGDGETHGGGTSSNRRDHRFENPLLPDKGTTCQTAVDIWRFVLISELALHQKLARSEERMKRLSLARMLFTLAALVVTGAACAADVQVMISAGFYGVYSELGPAFEHVSGHHLVTTRGPSMGDSPEAIPTRLARGETADAVILDAGALDELAKKGLVRADSKVELARSLIGMVVRAGEAKPDISSVEGLRNTLLAAKSIAYSDSGSGTYLSATLFPKLGIADQIAVKARKVRGPPSGEPVAAVVARGEAQIGFQQVSELIHVPGIAFVGTIPAEVQPAIFFAGALTNTARQPDAAAALVRFLASSEAAPTISKAGLMPLSDRRDSR